MRQGRARKEEKNQSEDLADVLTFKTITCFVAAAAQVNARQGRLEFEEVWRE